MITCLLIGSPAGAAPETVTEPAAPPTIKMIFGVFRPPYIFEKQDKGLDFEITQAVVETMGLKLITVHGTNRRGWSELETKKVDAMVGVTPDKTSKTLHFSEPILIYDNVAISKEKKKISIQTIEDLKKVRFLSFSNASRYLGPDYQKVVSESKRVTDNPDQRKQNVLFWSDKIDVVIQDLNVFRFYQRELAGELKTSEPVVIHRVFPLKTNWRAVAFRDKVLRDQFNTALATIRSNGRYQSILDKYLKVELLDPTKQPIAPQSL